MWLISLAWKNLWRNKTRTAVTMAAVYFAVVLSVFVSSLQDGVFDNLIKNVVSFYTGYVQVHKNGYWAEQVLDNGMAYDEALNQQILDVYNISVAAPRLETFGLITTDKNTKGCMVAGIDPEKENNVTSLKSKMVKGSYLEPDDKEVLLSEGLADRIKAGIHDTIYLIGQGYHGATSAGRFRVLSNSAHHSSIIRSYISAFRLQLNCTAQKDWPLPLSFLWTTPTFCILLSKRFRKNLATNTKS